MTKFLPQWGGLEQSGRVEKELKVCVGFFILLERSNFVLKFFFTKTVPQQKLITSTVWDNCGSCSHLRKNFEKTIQTQKAGEKIFFGLKNDLCRFQVLTVYKNVIRSIKNVDSPKKA